MKYNCVYNAFKIKKKKLFDNAKLNETISSMYLLYSKST